MAKVIASKAIQNDSHDNSSALVVQFGWNADRLKGAIKKEKVPMLVNQLMMYMICLVYGLSLECMLLHWISVNSSGSTRHSPHAIIAVHQG